MSRYDTLGVGYAASRRPDPRIAHAIHEALGAAGTILNVGAGSGSYEPADRRVVSVEPSKVMIAQRPAGAAPVVRATAEGLPFPDARFDAALAILTVHHWPDRIRGLAELRRVARDRVVLLTWDPGHEGFWLVQDYFPEILAVDRRIFPSLEEIASVLGGDVEVRPLPIPRDCRDGFLGAYWQRPHAYLQPAIRAAISAFADVPDAGSRLERLRLDLASGRWAERYAPLAPLEALDAGYRLVVGRVPARFAIRPRVTPPR